MGNLDREISLLEKELPTESQEIAFCHNDMQYGNIMIDEKTKDITIIVSVVCYQSEFIQLVREEYA